MEYSPSDFIKDLASLSITFGVVFSYLQIKKVSKSIDIGQKSNLINVLNYFSGEYDSLVIEEDRCKTARKVEIWYFRFWNLLTNEFLFFQKGLLDDYIFEFWSFKICVEYDSKPKHMPLKNVETLRESHLKYLDNHNGSHENTEKYFRELIAISETTKDAEEIRVMVRALVKKYKH
ncbi:MAG: hypothetical protein WC178_00395 [Candidatus Paceibacterota bacterium]